MSGFICKITLGDRRQPAWQPDRLEHFPALETEGCKRVLLPCAWTQRHHHHLCTSLLLFAGAQTARPCLPQWGSWLSALVPCQTQQLRTHHCLSPTVAAPGMSAGGGWIENSPFKISYFQCPIFSQTLPLSHLELWDCIFFARITAVCKQDQFQQPLLGREIKFCFNFKSVSTELPPQIPRVRLHFSLQPALHGMEYTWQTF